MQALLASLVVSMGVKDTAYKAGMAAARAEAKKTGQEFDKSTDGMANAVERTAKRVNEAAVRIADAVAEAGQKVRTTGLALTAGLTLGLGGMAKVSKDAASDFQAAMNDVHAAMIGASPEILDRLRAAAIRLGPEMGRSATEAAMAISALARNGLSAADILSGGLENALKLGVLGQTDLGKAADATTDILQQFHLTTDSLPDVVNKVSGALDASKLDFNGYADAIGMVGGIAGGLGYSFNDMNTALAAVIPLMTGGSDAGTSFKTFLLSLIPQSKDAADVMTKLGISFRNADGTMKNLSEVANVLNTRMANLTDASKQDALTKMFGTDGMRVALALMQAGAKGIADVQAQIDKAKADDKIAVLMDGEAAATQRLASAWEQLKIAVGDAGLLQAFTLIKNTAASVIGTIAGAPPWFMKLGVAVGAVAAATGPMILVMLTLAKVALPLLLLRLGPVALGFAALINPVGVVIRLLGQLALQAGASAMLQALGARLLALAGPIGLAVSLLTLLAPLMFKTAEASQAARDAAMKLGDANGAATETATRLATATGKARDEVLNKAKADRVAAAAAIASARANLVAARAELARAHAQAPKSVSKTGTVLDLLAAGGFDPTLRLPRRARIEDARAEVAQRAANAKTAEDNFRILDDAINGAETAGKVAKVDMSFDDPKKIRTPKGRDAARDEANYLDELGRSRVERLQAEADLTGSVRARYTADMAAIEEERASYVRQNAVDKGLTEAESARLLAAKDEVLERRRGIAQQQLSNGLAQQAYDLNRTKNEMAQDEVRAAIDAADSIAARRDGELRLLDLQRQQEEADLDLIIATKATGTAEWSNALARKEALPGIYAQRRAASMRGNETSVETFTRQMNASSDAIRESVEDAGVSALRDLNTQMSDAILSAKDLGDAFANMGRRIVGSLLDIAIQQSLIRPLANSMFGTAGADGARSGGWFSSVGNFFASQFGGHRRNGGGISANRWYEVGENGPERFYPGISGTIVPNDGRGAGPASAGIARIVPSEYFDVVVDGRVVRGAGPIAQATTATSMQRAGRASSWRARQTMPA